MTASLDELREQARLTYRYWPIYLVLRLREIEQHLSPDERGKLLASGAPDLSRLHRLGLWSGGLPTGFTSPPPLDLPANADLRFTVESDALLALAQTDEAAYRLRLMRAPSEHADVLRHAADQLNTLDDPAAALESARTWAALHGARPLDWERVSGPARRTASTRPYPPRRRGKGLFRAPR